MIDKLIIENSLVKNRENTRLEFKKTFHLQIKSYIKSIAAFANNSGGQIIFGVENTPRKPVGLDDFNKFDCFDNKVLSTCIQNSLSVNVEFEIDYFKQEIGDKEIVFGYLIVNESNQKPVICKVTDGKEGLREGAIYYRYSAKNEEIKAQDLMKLIQDEKDKEKQLWLQHLQKITQKGVQNVGVFSYDGEMFAGNHKIIIDKEAVKQIKFIKEGNFVEKDGATALMLKGKIEGMESLEVITVSSDPNKTHPYSITQIGNELKKLEEVFVISKNKDNKDTWYLKHKINGKRYTLNFLLSLIKSKLNLEKDSECCWVSKNNTVKQYSTKFLLICNDYFTSYEKITSLFN